MPAPSEDHPSMDRINISVTGVEKLLKTLNPYKAPGPDGISPRVLRELAAEVAPILTIIYRSTLETGTSSFFSHRDPAIVKWMSERKLDL